MDLGLLILRLVVGGLFIGHGTQKLFGWFGGHGPRGTARFLESLGYRPGPALAGVAGLAETMGGLSLVLGLATPLGAAAIIGMMTNAIGSVHWKNGLWSQNGGSEFPLTMAAAASCLAFAGAGAWSIDGAAGWPLSGFAFGGAAMAIGLATGLAMLEIGRTVIPAEERRRGAA